MTYIFPGIIIVLSLGASIVYGCSGDLRRCIYWFAGTLITTSMTIPDSWYVVLKKIGN